MGRKGKKNPRIQSNKDSQILPNKDSEDSKHPTKDMTNYFARVYSHLPNEKKPIDKCNYCGRLECIKLETKIHMYHAHMILLFKSSSDDEGDESDDEGLPYINCLKCIQSLEIFVQNQLLWHNKRAEQLFKGTCCISSGLCPTVANKIATYEASLISEKYLQKSQHVCSSKASGSNSKNESKLIERLMYQ
jgi:hypothetical protein